MPFGSSLVVAEFSAAGDPPADLRLTSANAKRGRMICPLKPIARTSRPTRKYTTMVETRLFILVSRRIERLKPFPIAPRKAPEVASARKAWQAENRSSTCKLFFQPGKHAPRGVGE